MGTHVSNSGNWHAAKEKVSLVNNTDKPIKHPITGQMIGPGEPYIYEGPDRGATEQYANGDIVSRHFSKDPEFIARVRQIHNMSMEEYMKMEGYDEKTSQIEFEKKLAIVNLHKDPVRKESRKQRSGGQDTAGTAHYSGDFGTKDDAVSKVK